MLYSTKDDGLTFNTPADAIAHARTLASQDRFYRLALYDSKRRGIGCPHLTIELAELSNETDNGKLLVTRYSDRGVTQRTVPFRLALGWAVCQLPSHKPVMMFEKFSEARAAVWAAPFFGHGHNVQFIGRTA